MESGKMKKLIAIGVVSTAISASAMAQNAVQWRVEDGGNGHWYQGVVFPPATAYSWNSARNFATSHGGDLATLTTTAEANWVFDRLASNQALWEGDFGPYVGLYQLEGATEPGNGWVWVDGTPNTGTLSWYWNQPDNFAASCGGDQFAAYWTGGPWFPAPRNYVGDMSGSGFCCCDPGIDRIPSSIIEYSADCNNDGIVDYGQIRTGEYADANANNIPDCCEYSTPCDCAADIIQDNAINGVDLAAIMNAWGTDGGKLPRCDVDGSGIVDGSDLTIVLDAWGPCP